MSESKASLQKDRDRLHFLLRAGYIGFRLKPEAGAPPETPPRFVTVGSIDEIDALIAAHVKAALERAAEAS